MSEKREPFWTGPGYRGEYNCPHGTGHGNHVHGCDGCCNREDFPLNATNIEVTRERERRRSAMAFDRDCSTYWCDECGYEMVINYKLSGEGSLILSCRAGCDFHRHFTAKEIDDGQGRHKTTE